MPKSKKEIQQDYRDKAAKRGLVQRCVVIPIIYTERLKKYAKQLRDEWKKTL